MFWNVFGILDDLKEILKEIHSHLDLAV